MHTLISNATRTNSPVSISVVVIIVLVSVVVVVVASLPGVVVVILVGIFVCVIFSQLTVMNDKGRYEAVSKSFSIGNNKLSKVEQR